MPGFNINSLTLSGALTRDPELKTLSSGTSVCGMRLAYNTRRKDGASGEWTDQSNYIDLTAWGNIGEWYAKNLHRGSQVVVHGELRWREWETNEGEKRQAYDLNVDSLVPVGERQSNGASRSDVPVDEGDFVHTPAKANGDDDIPF